MPLPKQYEWRVRGSNMNTLLMKFYSIKLRSKFMLSYIVIILFTVLAISIINYKISESTLIKNTSRFSDYLLEQISINLESRAKDIEDFIFIQFNSSGLNRHIRTSDETRNQVEIYNKRRSIDNFLYNLLNSKQYIKSVLIIDKFDNRYFRQKDGVALDADELYATLDFDGIKNLWGSSLWKKGKDKLLYIERALFDSDSTEFLGLVVVAIDSSYLSRLYDTIDRIEGGRIVLLDNTDSIMVYGDRLSEAVARHLSQGGLSGNGRSWSFTYDGHEYISTLRSSANSKWKVLNIITVRELTKNSQVLKVWTITACLVSFLVALVIAILISKNITENIRLLVKNIKKISEGNFNTRIKPKSLDEVGMLAEEFNSMAEKINTLINSIYHEQILKKNAEYKALQFEYSALQAQINPHFLYNTLETINSMAKLKGENEISEMVYLLGNLLRESISKKNNIVPLEEELHYIRNYLQIQKISYGDRLNVIYDLDESLSKAQVPKFMLQPIVENAIVHGIEGKIGQGTIIINCFRHEDSIVFEVADNGVGMDRETIVRILGDEDYPEAGGKKHTKVGIRSVDKRIRILYGDSYGVKISSRIGGGTSVEISIPLVLPENGVS